MEEISPQHGSSQYKKPSQYGSRIWNSYQSVLADSWSSIRRLEEDGGLHHIIDVKEHLAMGHDLISIIKRCFISSSFIVLKTPKMMFTQPGPDEYLAGDKPRWEMSPELHKLEDYLLINDLHENEYCIILPQSTTVNADIAGGESMDQLFEEVGKVNMEIRELEKHVYSLPVSADYPMVRRLLKQDTSSEFVNTGLIMPQINNLSLIDLTQLRKDYGDSFAIQRSALKKYLNGISEFTSERKFKEVIEEIDAECRLVDGEFKKIQRKHSRSLDSMLITSGIICVATVADQFFTPGIGAAITAAVGTVTLGNALSQRVSKLDQVDELNKSKYWITWKINQENEKRGQ